MALLLRYMSESFELKVVNIRLMPKVQKCDDSEISNKQSSVTELLSMLK